MYVSIRFVISMLVVRKREGDPVTVIQGVIIRYKYSPDVRKNEHHCLQQLQRLLSATHLVARVIVITKVWPKWVGTLPASASIPRAGNDGSLLWNWGKKSYVRLSG
jgi:hypothetical protein